MCFRLAARQQNSIRECGFTLLELSLVVLILGIMAAAVIPSLMSADSGKLHAAASQTADAMRFARSEAMRLRQPRGFHFNATSKRIRVFSVNYSVEPWTRVYDIYHPVSKNIYDIRLGNELFAADDSISTVRLYRGTCNQVGSVYFDANGIPRCINPQTVLLDQYDITLNVGDHTRVVSLEPISGRVTIR